ncbi:hypothetical protein KR074_005499, partial [Drosophila pseudoananassae]
PSMFPAYSGGAAKIVPGKEKEDEKPTTSGRHIRFKNCVVFVPEKVRPQPQVVSSDSSDSSDQESTEDEAAVSSSRPLVILQRPVLEFDGTEEYYVDKKGNNIFRSPNVTTIGRPSKPNYCIRMKYLKDCRGALKARRLERSKTPRYITGVDIGSDDKLSELTMQKQQAKLQELKVAVKREPENTDHWLGLHHMLGLNLYKANRLSVSEHQLYFLEQALAHHPSSEQLLHLYTDTASAAYPASQVADLLKRMLDKNPYQYTFWTSMIMATQGTMARCNVPDVLRIYEDSMRRMQLGHTDATSKKIDSVDTDPIMMKLFNNCCLFLRQSGNLNQLFALIRLALELNFPGQAMDCLEATAADEQPLIEYEELVLSSGLPMAQIWTRVELLRQAFHYLPYPQMRPSEADTVQGGLDPQRCIFTEDVCHYAYPLKVPENRLQLMLLVVQLMKLPISTSECLAARLGTRIDHFGESDAVEMMLAGMADRSSYAVSVEQSLDFAKTLMVLVKELSVAPSYLPHMIGNELYTATLSKLLLSGAAAFHPAERKRSIFIVLWYRLQRLLLLASKLTGKLTEASAKAMRSGIRKLMEREENQEVTRFYVEYGMWEFERLEADGDPTKAFKIFQKLIEGKARGGPCLTCPDVMLAYITYAEMLIVHNRWEQARHMLCCLSRGLNVTSLSQDAAMDMMANLRAGKRHLESEMASLDMMSPIMLLEEYFHPHKLLIYARAHCLLLSMLHRSEDADRLLEDLLEGPLSKVKAQTSERRRFLREQVMDLRMLVVQLPIPPPLPLGSDDNVRRVQLASLVQSGLEEFPRNMSMLLRWSTFPTMQWYKMRTQFLRTEAGVISLLHMVVAASCRFSTLIKQSAGQDGLETLQTALRNRVMNMFDTFLPTNRNRSEAEVRQWSILKKNSLFWRLYLRSLGDVNASFERSKECLLTALDECPWDKSIYTEGAAQMPQELSHLQDLMIEKQLRMFALPEELEILRSS